VTTGILENDRNDALVQIPFNRILSLFCTFMTLQDKHNIRCKNRQEKLIEDFLIFLFLQFAQINLIFSYNVHVLYIYNLLSFCFYFSSIISPKGASFKENRLMKTARDALGTTSIFRFSTYENVLNFLNQSKYV
jgi:hypothetical protein